MTALLKAALLAALLWSANAHADAIADLKTFLATNSSLQGQFTQTVSQPAKSNRKPMVSSGTFAVQRPGKFRWVYATPYEQVIVSDGKQVWLYDADLKQVTIKPVSQALDASPAALLSGNQIDKLYDLHDLPAQNGVSWLRATPRNPDSTFKQVEIGLFQGKLAQMRLFDQFGQTTQIVIEQLQVNNKVDSKQFSFTPPKDVDVVQE